MHARPCSTAAGADHPEIAPYRSRQRKITSLATLTFTHFPSDQPGPATKMVRPEKFLVSSKHSEALKMGPASDRSWFRLQSFWVATARARKFSTASGKFNRRR